MKTTTKSIAVKIVAMVFFQTMFTPLVMAAIPDAPTPTVSALKVRSVFSDVYTPITATYEGWWATTISEESSAGSGNLVKKIDSDCCFGYGLGLHNMTSMTYIHVDIYPTTITSIIFGITSNGDKNKTITLTPNQWNAIDIPLSEFTGANLANIGQIGFWEIHGVFYFDNLYFYDSSASVDTEAPTAFTATQGSVTDSSVELLLNATDNSGNVVYDVTYGTTTLSKLGDSGVEKSFVVTGLNTSTAYSFSVVAKDVSGNTVSNPIVVNATTTGPFPTAPAPTVDALKVISVYSDTYTQAITYNLDMWWATSMTDKLTGGNNYKFISSNCCFGTSELTPRLDVSAMNKLHVDIYPTTATTISFGVTTSVAGGEYNLPLTNLTPGAWKAYDISLADLKTAHPALVFTDIKQIGFWHLNGDFYFDNIYFYNDTNTGISNVGAENKITLYPNPVKDNLTVSASSEIAQILVSNLVGQTVKSTTVNGLEQSIDLSDVSAGNYIVTIKLANGQLSNQKFVKL